MHYDVRRVIPAPKSSAFWDALGEQLWLSITVAIVANPGKGSSGSWVIPTL